MMGRQMKRSNKSRAGLDALNALDLALDQSQWVRDLIVSMKFANLRHPNLVHDFG